MKIFQNIDERRNIVVTEQFQKAYTYSPAELVEVVVQHDEANSDTASGDEEVVKRHRQHTTIQKYGLGGREGVNLPDLPSLIADRRHSLFGRICRLPENTPASQALQLSIEAHTGTPPAADWKRPPSRPRRTWLQQVEEDIELACLLVLPRLQAKIARCGGRYTPLSWSSAAVSE